MKYTFTILLLSNSAAIRATYKYSHKNLSFCENRNLTTRKQQKLYNSQILLENAKQKYRIKETQKSIITNA